MWERRRLGFLAVTPRTCSHSRCARTLRWRRGELRAPVSLQLLWNHAARYLSRWKAGSLAHRCNQKARPVGPGRGSIMNEIRPKGGIWSAWKHADIVDSSQCLYLRPIRGQDGTWTSGYTEGENTFGLTVSGTERLGFSKTLLKEEFKGCDPVQSTPNNQREVPVTFMPLGKKKQNTVKLAAEKERERERLASFLGI